MEFVEHNRCSIMTPVRHTLRRDVKWNAQSHLLWKGVDVSMCLCQVIIWFRCVLRDML